jgi:hypothetical protein
VGYDLTVVKAKAQFPLPKTSIMPLENLAGIVLIFLTGAMLYRFRTSVLAPFRRFEARNAQRRADEARALFDRHSHYRHTLEIAEEQVETVEKIRVPDERTGEPLERFLFLGVQYATLDEAEAVRRGEIIGKAREFYIDLDRNWLPRHTGGQDSYAPKLPPPKPPRP